MYSSCFPFHGHWLPGFLLSNQFLSNILLILDEILPLEAVWDFPFTSAGPGTHTQISLCLWLGITLRCPFWPAPLPTTCPSHPLSTRYSHSFTRSKKFLLLTENMGHIYLCVSIQIQIQIRLCIQFQEGKDKVYTPKLEILNICRSHCWVSSRSYPAQGYSCTAQATWEHQDTGKELYPGPQILPSLCSKLGGTVAPAGLIWGQGHGDVPILLSLRVTTLLGFSLQVVLCLSGLGVTQASHHHGRRKTQVSGLGRGCRWTGLS